MLENHDYMRNDRTDQIRLGADVAYLMLKGAGYAAIVCIVLLVLTYGTVWVGKFLPPESKEAPDPTPLSLVVPVTEHATV
ncbi:RC-LH1 core complex protein PufX [Sulfitobacter albidus]|uniref:RC-LH1 core complex protein PufX n=1 Tax=Sulfitobacter albidus TaxID=2829501 RepID=A0A975PP39_9RHOB|nr:RC-LH1 core complex protein PufX [Sulfitobacter albidus]QUJ78409.1 RC-LH1 core complex protein PufX [Sulfitobacter albidus]